VWSRGVVWRVPESSVPREKRKRKSSVWLVHPRSRIPLKTPRGIRMKMWMWMGGRIEMRREIQMKIWTGSGCRNKDRAGSRSVKNGCTCIN